jgi:hypothetical protein
LDRRTQATRTRAQSAVTESRVQHSRDSLLLRNQRYYTQSIHLVTIWLILDGLSPLLTDCRTLPYRIMEGLPVIRPRSKSESGSPAARTRNLPDGEGAKLEETRATD